MKRVISLIALFMAMTFLLAACPVPAAAPGTGTVPESTATAAAETPMSGATSEMTDTEGMTDTTGSSTAAGAVQVSLIEYAIEMPTSIPAGPTTFEITNNGTEEHGFEIEGGEVEEALEPRLQPGETGTLQVDLPPGTYEVYCPVSDHADEGMRIELTVTD